VLFILSSSVIIIYDIVVPGSFFLNSKQENTHAIWHHSSTFSWKHKAADATSDDHCHFERDAGRFLGGFVLSSLNQRALTGVTANTAVIE